MIFAYGLSNNIVAYYITPVTQSMGFSRAAFNFSFTLMSVVSFITAPVYGYLYMKVPVRRIILTGALVGAFCYLGYAACKNIGMFYVVGVLQGLVQNGATNMSAVVLINRFFDEQQRGIATGIVMSGTGVCSLIMSTFLPQFIEHYGWNRGYLLCGGLWLLVMVTAVLLVRENPEEKRLEGQEKTEKDGIAYHQAIRSRGFYALLISVLFCNIVMVCSQHLPSYFRDMGLENETISSVMMVFSLGLIVWKIVLGRLYDKLGAVAATVIAYISYIFGMWILAIGTIPFLTVGSLIAALGIASSTVLSPLITRSVFGEKEYAPIWSLVSMTSAFGVATGSPIWGTFYDCFGSYRAAFLGAPILLAVALLLLVMLLRKNKKHVGRTVI